MKQAWYIAENDGLSCTIRDAEDHDEDGDGMVCEQATPDDARLIAAAPAMLEALKSVLLTFGPSINWDGDCQRRLAIVEAVIAKAKGE
tara:strand:+ start:61 stop:324 length:264 start_codon:yes stop_codon:yes gene_type:complete